MAERSLPSAAPPGRGVLLLLLGGLLFGLAPAANAQELLRSYPGPQALAPGDLIRLTFWREVELGGDFAIDEDGAVVLPILGTWDVSGVPSDELREQLREAYGHQLRNQDVQILFLHRVSILGAVENPGLYHVDATMSLRDAVALAGGVTEDGRTDRMDVRGGPEATYTTIAAAGVGGPGLLSVDEINVPRKSWFVRNSVPLLGGVLSATAIILSRAWF